MTSESNVFSVLARYAGRSEENYLTESLVFLVRLLLDREPEKGLKLVNLLCAVPDEPWFTHAPSVQITTQVAVEAGRPDIEVRSGDNTLVYVEVKHDSLLGPNQLERYKGELMALRKDRTRLVLLSRSRYTDIRTSLDPSAYHRVFWHEIHDCLKSANTGDDVCRYFCDSMMAFLEEKNMSVKQVGWEYIRGVPAMLDLTNMLEAASQVAFPEASRQRTAGWSWRGWYIAGDYFVGLRFDEPMTVVFEDNKGYTPKSLAYELDLEAAHFFSLKNHEQLDRLVKFLLDSSQGIAVLRQVQDDAA